MNKFWKAFISPSSKKFIQRADDFMELVISYGAKEKILGEARDFIKADTGPEVKGGFLNMIFLIDDHVFNIHFRKRPERYFEVLLSFRITLLSENFVTDEKEKDLHIIFEKAQEISERQYKRLTTQFKTMTPAEKTMQLIKKYPFLFKHQPVTK